MNRALYASLLAGLLANGGPLATPVAPLSPQAVDRVDLLHGPLDQLLDLYVRDGFVYYQALKVERRSLDRYISALDGPAAAPALYESWSREQQVAFWVNAYNAFVLHTVVEHYPIRGRAPQYPPNSVRQIPGAFDRLTHRAAGRTVTLDAIEKMVLSAFKDPRVYLALGRGSAGGGRLRSEAYTGGHLQAQLTAVAREFVSRRELMQIDSLANRVTVTPLIGWRAEEFVAAYGNGQSRFGSRSPIERALLAFIQPNLLPHEREFLEKNTFAVSYHEFDWRLNDLTGGRF